MPDELSTPETKEKPVTPQTTRNSLTAAIGLIATATIHNVVLTGIVVASAPFVADGIIWLLTTGAEQWKAHRKKTEPIRAAEAYLKTIDKRLRKLPQDSPERPQLEADKAEVERIMHTRMLQELRLSVGQQPLPPPGGAPTP